MRPPGAAWERMQLHHLAAQVGGGHQQAPVLLPPAVAGEHVEQLAEVGADVLVVGEQAQVVVEARRLRVVVAGADVGVAHQAAALATHHQGDLGVGLEPGHPVDHVDPGLFEQAGPGDVGLLVEAGLQLDQDGHLLALARRGISDWTTEASPPAAGSSGDQVRYRVCLMATTSGSREASARKAPTEVVKDS